MNQQKDALREQLKKQRSAMTRQQVEKASRVITEQALVTIDWSQVTSVHSYSPISSQHEVDTTLLCETVRKAYPHIKLATWQHTDGRLNSLWITPEPEAGKSVPPTQQFDVIIIPLLGFMEDGSRIGYGSGTYDRFLATQKQALTIGLSYELGHLPAKAFQPELHDIPLAQIITERAVYT